MITPPKSFHIFAIFSLGFLTFPARSLAHVGYIVPKDEISNHAGSDFTFLFHALTEPINISLIIGTIVVVAAIYFFLRKNSFITKNIALVQARTESYFELTPWMMRLGLGIALIGTGTMNALISPILSDFPQFSFIQILLGFLLLSGFLLAPATLLIIFLFLFAILKNFYLFGNVDLLALAIALLIMAKPKPGVDDLLGLPFFSPLKSFQELVPLILRIGIGGAMLFLAVYEKFLNPHLSRLVVENYHLTSIIPVTTEMWVLSAGLIEFAVGFALLIGFQTRLVAAIAFLVLSLSFFYFHEAVYSHVTLFTTLSILFVTGGGKLSIDKFVTKHIGNPS